MSETKNKIYELARKLVRLKSDRRIALNELDNIEREIANTEIEIDNIIRVNEERRMKK